MARNTLTAFVAAVLVFLFSVSCGNAGDAVFSSDGERVYLISDIESKPAVEEIDLNKKTARKILLAQLFAGRNTSSLRFTRQALVSYKWLHLVCPQQVGVPGLKREERKEGRNSWSFRCKPD
jgi:hypothetical protein